MVIKAANLLPPKCRANFAASSTLPATQNSSTPFIRPVFITSPYYLPRPDALACPRGPNGVSPTHAPPTVPRVLCVTFGVPRGLGPPHRPAASAAATMLPEAPRHAGFAASPDAPDYYGST